GGGGGSRAAAVRHRGEPPPPNRRSPIIRASQANLERDRSRLARPPGNAADQTARRSKRRSPPSAGYAARRPDSQGRSSRRKDGHFEMFGLSGRAARS